MGYQTLPSQQADLTVPANAMTNQASIGSNLTKGVWDYDINRRSQAESKRQFDESLKERIREWEENKKMAKDKEEEDFWSDLISKGLKLASFIPGPQQPFVMGASTIMDMTKEGLGEYKPLSTGRSSGSSGSMLGDYKTFGYGG